jgi:hypothetical protein
MFIAAILAFILILSAAGIIIYINIKSKGK